MPIKIIRIIFACVYLCGISGITHAVEKVMEQKSEFKYAAYLHFVKGLLFEKEGQLEEALREYAETVKIDPEASYVHRSLSTLNVKVGRIDAALEAVERLQKLDDANVDTYFLAGSIYLLKGDLEKSVESFLKVLELEPSNKDALLYLAGIVSEKEPARAIEYLKKYIAIDPQSPEVYFELGMLYQTSSKKGYERAVKSFEKAVELDPAFFNAYLGLAQLQEKHNNYTESIAAYENCLELDPDNKLLRAHLGILYLHVGDVKKAEEIYMEAAGGESPEDLSSLFWLGILTEDTKDWPNAIRYLEQSIKEKKDVQSLLRLSYYYIKTNKRKKAMELLHEAKIVDPEDIQIRIFLAYGYQEIGSIPEAIKELEEIVVLDPNHFESYFQLGVLYEQQGKFYKAIPYFYKALEIDPQSPAASNYLGYSYADRRIKLDEAERLIKTALEKEPDNPAYLDSIGWIYYRNEKYADALAELAKAEKGSEDPIITDHLGDAYWALAVVSEGKASMEHALNSWKKALTKNPSDKAVQYKIIQRKKQGLDFIDILDHTLKLFIENQERIESVSGLFVLDGCEGKKRFKINGLLFYEKPDRIRIDLLGPLMQKWCSLIYADNKLKLNPPRALDQFTGSGTAIAQEITLFTAAYLNKAIAGTMRNPGMLIRSSWKKNIIYDKSITVKLHKKNGMLASYDYFLESGERASVMFKYKRNENGIYVPSQITFIIPVYNIKIKMKFKDININNTIDKKIFD
ncbi:MAG: tetratricopeptide repeat protein [bacterium]